MRVGRYVPNVVIPAGTYTIVDSSPSTWAQNGESGGRGHASVEGRAVASSTASAPAVAARPAPPVASGPEPARTAAASPAVPDRVPATGAWVLEKTEFVVEKVDPPFMQKFQPSESGEDGAGSAESTIGLLRSRMNVVWTSPPRVLIPGKAIDIRMAISDAGSSPERLVWGTGGVGANCPALSAVWYGPAVSISSKPGEGTKEASKAYTPPSAPPGTTMYIAAEWSVGSRRNTFYYLYTFVLDAGQARAPASGADPAAERPASKVREEKSRGTAIDLIAGTWKNTDHVHQGCRDAGSICIASKLDLQFSKTAGGALEGRIAGWGAFVMVGELQGQTWRFTGTLNGSPYAWGSFVFSQDFRSFTGEIDVVGHHAAWTGRR